MIGVSVSDILKILDQIPIWKTLSAMPKRLKDLEDRVAALEQKPAANPENACPICEEPMKVTKVRDDPTFGMMGLKQHTLSCAACGHTETRQVDPRKHR